MTLGLPCPPAALWKAFRLQEPTSEPFMCQQGKHQYQDTIQSKAGTNDNQNGTN